eukprot:jgi/Chrzof1/713/Cz01g26010.t1
MYQQAEKESAQHLDIECLPEDQTAPVIEMDLACGIFDILDDQGLAAAQRAVAAGGTVVAEPFDGGSDSSRCTTSSTSTSDEEDEDDTSVQQQPEHSCSHGLQAADSNLRPAGQEPHAGSVGASLMDRSNTVTTAIEQGNKQQSGRVSICQQQAKPAKHKRKTTRPPMIVEL